ncbi:MAG: hypothetical protein HYZ92_00065, partial [Candidatus Omnitrophica bacterium]|nr:hypothetical protein [Candidatus Omnitrophota bacterium]
RHFQERRPPVQFTRSRAYHKDDNAHIEQKHWTHVRQWLGYQRFDDPRLVAQLNELYTSEWRLLHNFFLPSVKLLAKRRLGSNIMKVHDVAKTPAARVLESAHVSQAVKQRLTDQLRGLNPLPAPAGHRSEDSPDSPTRSVTLGHGLQQPSQDGL